MKEESEDKEIRMDIYRILEKTYEDIEELLEQYNNDPCYFAWDIKIRFKDGEHGQISVEKKHPGMYTDGEKLEID